MLVEIWSDIACPWCYIGKRRFEKAVKCLDPQIQVEVQWNSFELSPTTPKGTSEPVADFLVKHKGITKAEALGLFPGVTKIAAGEGLAFRFDIAQHGNTFDAHRLIHFARTEGRGDAMKERLLSAYFERGESTADISKLLQMAVEIGLAAGKTKTILESDKFSKDVKMDVERGRKLGMNGVPFFLVNGKYTISGAQSPEEILRILQMAAGEEVKDSGSASVVTHGFCDENGCAK